MKRFKLLACVAAITFATAAVAGGPEVPVVKPPWYIGAEAGIAFLGGNQNNYFQTGYDVGGQLGYRFNNFRVEAAFSYIRHDVKVPALTAANLAGVAAHLNSYLTMLNAYYDINFGSAFMPYLGAGIGWAHLNSNVPGSIFTGGRRHFVTVGYSDNFAYQGIVGFDYEVSPLVTVGMDYRITGYSDHSSLFENRVKLHVNYFFNLG